MFYSLARRLALALLIPITVAGAAMSPEIESAQKPNKLADETSPYLLQHAHNPVQWHPWGEEAFEEARERNLPIFLSIGYSTCYWCHVMERESFENEEIAAIMNERFVCIKVDREERPDVDDIYMSATQLISGGGGWPMSVWLTPPGAAGDGDGGLKPFFAGTYYPAESREGMPPSFPDLLINISEIWERTPEQIIEQADRVAAEVSRRLVEQNTEPVRVDQTQIQAALAQLINIYDREHGGFGRAPKFPQSVFSEFLFEMRDVIADPAIRSTVESALKHTLDRMATGGMYDQIGGGFHRYSTDKLWLVPHFEKMLYDNGQLASIYALSAVLTGDEFHARVCADILTYVTREMTSDGGAFFSAQDAEVNAREGLNYLWTAEQIRAALNEDDAEFAAHVFGIDKGTNFTDPHFPADGPKNVLFLPARPEAIAAEMGIEPDVFAERLSGVREQLYNIRAEREQPRLDDKIIAGWNGLMIKGFADGAIALRNIEYLSAAERAADNIYETMRAGDGSLYRTSRNGKTGPPAFLDDYSFFVSGLLAMHRTSAVFGRANPEHLTRAIALTDIATRQFSDDESGAFFDTLADQADLFVRTRTTYDGAVPSGQSVMLHNLIDLYDITRDKQYLERAISLVGSMSRDVMQSPLACVNTVRGLQRLMKIDTTIPERFGEPFDSPRPAQDIESPVKVLTTGERITIPKQGVVTLPVRIEIEKPFHINAHEPGVGGLTGLTVGIAGGTGVRVVASYPKGDAYEGSAIPDELGTLLVHAGVVEFELELSQTDEPREGRPMLIVTYQVCSDTACFQPLTVELDIALDLE